jgi:hypothetical protein
MHWRTWLALVGAIIWLLAIAGTIWHPAPLPPFSMAEGDASRSHSNSTTIIKTGACGPIQTRKQINEHWSWRWTETMVVGSSGELKVYAEITDVSSTIAGPVEGKCPSETRRSRPDLISEPMTLLVSGPFWKEEQKQTTPSNHPNPLEWSWVLTPSDIGDKIIQLELPTRPKESAIKTTRTFEVRDAANNPSSRFVRLPVSVSSAGWLSPNAQSILFLLAWLVGPAFSAPWLAWLVKRVLKPSGQSNID